MTIQAIEETELVFEMQIEATLIAILIGFVCFNAN